MEFFFKRSTFIVTGQKCLQFGRVDSKYEIDVKSGEMNLINVLFNRYRISKVQVEHKISSFSPGMLYLVIRPVRFSLGHCKILLVSYGV